MKFKRILLIALSILSATALIGIPACTPKSDPAPKGKVTPKFVAHRGYSHAYPDNTEASFRAAASMSFYGIETDIRMTKDGYFVCNHDDTVKYADGSEMVIASTKLSDLMEKPVKNDRTSEDAYVCTFETYLQACKEGGKVAVIELKEYFKKATVEKVFEIIDREYDRKKVTFISFSYPALTVVQGVDPSIELQYLSQDEDDSRFELCLKKKISVDVKKTILTEELVKSFHDAGLKVNVWTVDEEEYLDLCYQYGVDYITTNGVEGRE